MYDRDDELSREVLIDSVADPTEWLYLSGTTKDSLEDGIEDVDKPPEDSLIGQTFSFGLLLGLLLKASRPSPSFKAERHERSILISGNHFFRVLAREEPSDLPLMASERPFLLLLTESFPFDDESERHQIGISSLEFLKFIQH